MTTITTGAASENDSTFAVRDTAEGSKNRTTGGSTAAVKALFGAAKALLCRKDEDEPQRRNG